MEQAFQAFRPYLLPTIFTIVLVGLLPLVAGYLSLLERKVMADMQARLGPMRVGPHGLLQPIADALKLLIKEDIIPLEADKWVFWLAPIISVTAALTVFSLIPFSHRFYVTDSNVGLLLILGISSLGIFGIILGGWASNSHYPLLGALRSAAQLVSYEVAMGFSIIGGLLLAGTLGMRGVVEAKRTSGVWFAFYQPVAFFIFVVASVAETNRAPFDLPEAESELVAGYHTEYSGFRWSLYMLAEYCEMIVVSAVAVTLFLGGWLSPFPNVHVWPLTWLHRLPPELWFLGKVFVFIYAFIWYRGTFPRYRFDQLMHLGWHFLIPLAMVNVIFCAMGIGWAEAKGWSLGASLWIGNLLTLLMAVFLARPKER